MSPVRRSSLAMIRWYQRVRQGQLSPCRFYPSCSQYAYEAVETHGTVRGWLLAVRRLSRCHPWGSHGFDPVPERTTHRV
jgi:uncharacterized protein